MKQIYTKTGDEGLTSLREGVRVAKDDPRIETNGQIDQLNACLGVVRSMLGDDEENRDLIHAVQRELMTVMSHLATPDGSENPRELHAAEITSQLERAIDQANFQGGFVVPGGGSQLSAFIHLARTAVLVMMNRLSDYLFVLSDEKE